MTDDMVTAELLLRFADGDRGDLVELTRAEFTRRLPYVKEVSVASYGAGPGWSPSATYLNPHAQPEVEPEPELPAEPVDVWET